MSRLSTLIVAAALLLAGAPRSFAEEAQAGAPKFEIQRAAYEPIEGEGGADVTELVKGMVKDGVLSLTASNVTLGGDPTPGRVKHLRVEYTLDGKALVAIVAENGSLEIPPLTPQQRAAKSLAALKAGAPLKEKLDACRELATLGDKEAVPMLAGLLPDPELSHMARYALEAIPDSAAEAALREALGKVKGTLLVGVINSVGVRRDAKASDALIGLLQAADPEVASAAAVALSSLATPAAADALGEALGKAPAAVRPALCDACLRCADAFTAQGKRDKAVPFYDRLRGAAYPDGVRVAAMRGAILARQAAGAKLLVQQLHSAEPCMFAAALRVALELPGADVTKALAAELSKLPAAQQPLLMQALAKRGDRAALPALLSATKTGDNSTRVAALQALPPLADASVVPALVEAIGSPEGEIAQAARDSLASVPGKEADAAVLTLVGSPEVGLRLAGIELVGQRRMTTAIAALLKAGADPDQAVRVSALVKLRDLGGTNDVPALLALLLNAKVPQELDTAEETLSAVAAQTGDPEACAERLLSALPNAEPAQKCALLGVLSAVGGTKALQTVRASVDDSNADLHSTAVRTLGEWRTLDAAPVLLDLAKTVTDATEKQLCFRGCLRLASLQEAPADQRLALCRQIVPLIQRDGEKKLLLGALGTIPSAESLAMIAPYLGDAATKDEASAATVAVAEKLVDGPDASKLAEPLQKAAQATANADLVKRAKALLRQVAKKNAGQ